MARLDEIGREVAAPVAPSIDSVWAACCRARGIECDGILNFMTRRERMNWVPSARNNCRGCEGSVE